MKNSKSKFEKLSLVVLGISTAGTITALCKCVLYLYCIIHVLLSGVIPYLDLFSNYVYLNQFAVLSLCDGKSNNVKYACSLNL